MIGIYYKSGELSDAVGLLTSIPFSYSVAATWGVVALAGRWRSEPTWLDRAGRVLGGYWVVATLFWFPFIYCLVN